MKHLEYADKIYKAAMREGFDWAEITVRNSEELCVRVANSSVCRENVLRDNKTISITGCLEGRRGSIKLPGSMHDRVADKLTVLHKQLLAQPVDKEFVMPHSEPGTSHHDLTSGDFLETYGPETLYPALEQALSTVRNTGMRSTGYIEAKQGETAIITSNGTQLTVRDHGISSGFTVDHPDTLGASGSSQESGVCMNRDLVAELVSRTVEEACHTADLNKTTNSVEAGDYTVVLHPRAVADIMRTMLMYRMFDRRRIDENQTYLSSAKDTLRFPAGLSLAQSAELKIPEIDYREVNVNGNLKTCDDLHLLRNGKIQDLHTSAYWAQKTSGLETYGPYASPPVTMSATSEDGFAGGIHQDLDALIASTERGIYVANTWYLRMVSNMEGTITGMTRDGVFAIENGKLTKPLNNMRWHENPFRVFSEVDAVSRQLHLLGLSRWASSSNAGLTAVPAMRIPAFHFSSQTRF